MFNGDEDGDIGRYGVDSNNALIGGLAQPGALHNSTFGFRIFIQLKDGEEVLCIRNAQMTAHTMTQNQLKTLLPMSAYTTCGFSHYGHNFVQTYFLRKLLGKFTHKGKSGKKATKKKR